MTPLTSDVVNYEIKGNDYNFTDTDFCVLSKYELRLLRRSCQM